MSLRPPPSQPHTLAGPAGALEAVLEEPADLVPRRFAVICHPHPLHGGTLHNKVVHTLARTLQQFGMPTLRFNYRGVGASEGAYDEGRGETADALAAIQWSRGRYPRAALTLAGFSFGALVALRAAHEAAAERLIAVAPAVTRPGFSDVAAPECPWLLVQGDADEIIDCREVIAWAGRQVPRPSLAVLAGGSHFFHGRLHELGAAVRNGFDWS